MEAQSNGVNPTKSGWSVQPYLRACRAEMHPHDGLAYKSLAQAAALGRHRGCHFSMTTPTDPSRKLFGTDGVRGVPNLERPKPRSIWAGLPPTCFRGSPINAEHATRV
jgi:hypothetical protein